MSKEMYIAAHEELIERAMDEDPDLSWDEAYGQTADAAWGHMNDQLADMADSLHEKHRERGM